MTYFNRNSHDPLLSRYEAAGYIGVSSRTMAVWASTKRNELPFIGIGRGAKYRLSDLDAFIERNTGSKEVA